MEQSDYGLHRLGWKAFQDLCVALAEERLQRPVQTFLPTADAGRDGAFLGAWESTGTGESTIQCKFTSKCDSRLSLAMLADELAKVARLCCLGLADDYIILTNHTVTGRSELAIRKAFQREGVKRCRVFHRDWIATRIKDSPRLRMMVPRLYGIADLTSLLDARAYQQAQLILSEMGDNIQKLVVTEAHRKSVRAISEYNLVLLLGSPAAGKSTIGASLAIGASDIWKCLTVKSTSPEHLEQHIDPAGGQFFWIDDAWGSTQYQHDRTEKWNQVFPLIQGAMKRGSRFLITSRDYIWHAARNDLKLQALPILRTSQVVINVHELSLEEKARILYNHLKLGDQPASFRVAIKSILPALAKHEEFLPESARRLGTKLFTKKLSYWSLPAVSAFFSNQKDFLEQTIESLSAGGRAAVALVFQNGGLVRSPVPSQALQQPAISFGAQPSQVRDELNNLRGSLTNLVEDEDGPYWTYSHPTVSDAFASYVAKSPEMIDLYLQGAKAENIVQEVVCAGIKLSGAFVTVPNSLNMVLLDRIGNLPAYSIARFLSYRSNALFSKILLGARPDVWKRLDEFNVPLRDDMDVDLLVALHNQDLLPEERRLLFVEVVRNAAVVEADDSFISDNHVGNVLTANERRRILDEVRTDVLGNYEEHIDRVRDNWDSDYDPGDHFEQLEQSFKNFANALSDEVDTEAIRARISFSVRVRTEAMVERYSPPQASETPTQQSAAKADSLIELFRDVDS